jgi:hypothetical protein
MTKALVLRTCNHDLTSHGGFQWPESGPVSCPDWDPNPVCGHGLHGALWGEGDGSLLDWASAAKWLVVEIEADIAVELGGKVKFPAGVVIHCGDRLSATQYIQANGAKGAVIGGTSTSGYRGTSMSGDYGTSTSGYRGTSTSGYRGTSTSGDRGTSTSGNCGTSTSGNCGTSTSGEGGTSTSGEGGTSTAGYRGNSTSGDHGTSMSGYRGTSTSGYCGIIVCRWYGGNRHRLTVGYVGEIGILPNTPYKADSQGILVRA